LAGEHEKKTAAADNPNNHQFKRRAGRIHNLSDHYDSERFYRPPGWP
jgi:hypothetical protein